MSKTRKQQRGAAPALAAALLLLVVLSACRPGGPPVAAQVLQEREALAVETLTVSKGNLFKQVEGAGTISGINEAFVVSETQGIGRSVNFELGDAVEKGQILLQVDDTIPRLNAEQAKQQMETARIELEAAEKFYKEGSTSKAELFRARSTASGAKARYESAVKALRDTAIRAPISGSIAQRESSAAVGNLLTPGMRLARIVDISALKLEVAVGEAQVGLIEPGAGASVLIPAACDQKRFEARVKAVAAGSDPLTGSYTVVVSWENPCPDKIKAGMSARVSIETRQEQPVILIPSAALVQEGAQPAVYTAVGGRARLVPVVLGRRIGNTAEVLEGLQENDRIIISALSSLRQGSPVATTVIGESGGWQ